MKKVLSLLLILALSFSFVLALSSCSKDNVKIEIAVENFGSMTFILRSDMAPETVENFVNLIKEGFYDGLTFHRVYSGFMIQGGDPNGNGTGSSSKTIKGEFSANGYSKNTLSHKRGVISMARSNSYNSASCQFFICHADSTFLDGNYAAFGEMIDGYDVLDAIAAVQVTYGISGECTSPVTPVVIETIRVIK